MSSMWHKEIDPSDEGSNSPASASAHRVELFLVADLFEEFAGGTASPSLLSGFRCGGSGAVNKISDKRYAAISRKPFRSGPLLIAVLAVVAIVGVCWRSPMSWERAGSQLVRQE